MRIGLQTWGSDGDIRPFIALAGGLRATGHEVTLAATSIDNKDYRAVCERLGVRHVRAASSYVADLTDMARKATGANPARQFRILLEDGFLPHLDEIYRNAVALCEQCDLTVGHFFVYPVRAAALKTGAPYVTVTFCPAVVPTAYRPPFGMPDLGPRLNPLGWRLARLALDALMKRDVAGLWKREGLPPLRRVLRDAMYSDRLNLLAHSAVFCPEQPDWGGRHRVCGSFTIPNEAEPWTPPPGLTEFLGAGEPPVYMTLGSPQQMAPEKLVELLVRAAKTAGCRAIIQSGSPKYPPGAREGDLYFIGRTPHHRVFPHCAAVVHHGGAGTTHSVARCGRPSVVLPFMDEQLFWGVSLHSLGAAPSPLCVMRATPDAVARRIRLVLDDPAIGRRAERLGETMRRENGVAQAVALIERQLG